MQYEFAEATEAMRKSLNLENIGACKLEINLKKLNDKAHVLEIISDKDIFGTQPYLAIKTKNKDYFHDNLDFQIPKRRWTYTFDEETLKLEQIEKIGLAVNSPSGETTVSNIDINSGKNETTYLNSR